MLFKAKDKKTTEKKNKPKHIKKKIFHSFIEPVDDKVKPPKLTSSNFRCVEKITITCFVNKINNNCPKCASFTYVNTTTVNCTRCKSGFVDVLVNWTKPKTFSPIKRYRIQFGSERTFRGRSFGVLSSGAPLNRPPVSSLQSFTNKLLIILLVKSLEFDLHVRKRYLF